jgi:hypothetical protein
VSDVTTGFAQLADAAPGYEEAHSYYSGSVSEVFGSAAMKRLLRRQGKPFKVNVIKTVVDSVADRLDLMAVTVPQDEPATKRLDEIMESNNIAFEAGPTMRRGVEYGDAFVLVWEGAEDDDDPVVNYHSPLSMRIVYDPDNPRRKLYAIQAWEERTPLGDTTRWRANLWYPDRVERWRTQPGMKPAEATAWEQAPESEDDPDSWVSDNPFGEVPVFHFRNVTPFGTPRHYDGYGAQDAVNKLVISHMSTVDYHIFPQRYALSDGANVDDDFDLDDDPEFDDTAETDRESGSPSRGIASGPGQMQWFENVKSVGQFEPAKAEAFTGPLKMYLQLMSQVTKTPLDMLDDSGDEPSGESRRRKDAPLTSAIRDYSVMYAATWSEVFSFALKVAGMAERVVKVTFAPAEVVSDAEGWSTIKAKIEAGVPVRVALLEAGYSEEQVDDWYPEGEENTLRVVDLEAVSRILQQLGAAVALDIISAEEARALLPEGILPEGAPIPAPSPEPPSDQG